MDKEEETGRQAFSCWQEGVLADLRRNPERRLAIVEIGCGLRVPNIRKRCEELFAVCPSGQADFIRINPEHTEQQFRSRPTVEVEAPALLALQEINREILAWR